MKALIFLCLLCLPVFAAENVLTPEEKNAGWKLLFDGKTTEGWIGFPQKPFPQDVWTVKEGALKNVKQGKGAKGGSDIVTTQKFTDFEFKFEFKIGVGGNSGIKYLLREEQSGPTGCEYQVLDDERHEDAKAGPIRQTAALYQLIVPTNKTVLPVGEFNEGKIVVQGNHVEHWLNGKKVVEYETGSKRLRDAIAKSKYKNIPNFGETVATRILLQDHGEEVWFRNLRIRELPVKK